MPPPIATIARVLIQVVIGALSASVEALIIKALNRLSHDRETTQSTIPGGELHTRSMLAVGGALASISSFALFFVIPNSLYITRHKLPRLEKWIPNRLALKLMALIGFVMTPINIAQTYVTFTRSARVSSKVLPEILVEELVALGGKSLRYKDAVTVVEYTIIAWIVWLVLMIGVIIEVSKYGKDDDLSSLHSQENEKITK